MLITQFIAFYPSRPFWAVSEVDFSDQQGEAWFYEQMAKEMFSESSNEYTLKISRDGRIMLRVDALEKVHEIEGRFRTEQTVRKWGEYLNYLNAFYLLLDSSTIEISNFHYFNLHEITNRDAFSVSYENGKSHGESVSQESITSVFQMGRYSSSYQPGIPIEYNAAIKGRHVISLDIIKHVSSVFATVVATPSLAKTLASFAKSLSEYKIGGYETSLVISWFIIEAALSQLWKTHIEDLIKGGKRINSERKTSLTGGRIAIGTISNLLYLWGFLSDSQLQDIDEVRNYRNKVVHGSTTSLTPDASKAQLAMKTAQTLIEQVWKLRFTTNMGYTVRGI